MYRAQHPEHGVCAFKVLRQRLRGDPTAVTRFLREAGYGARIQHPGVVRTFDFGEAEGEQYLALEWAEGEPLADFAHREGRLEPGLVATLVTQLADSLGAAHTAGILHRDLKPENIIYNARTQTTKLLDFGIARDTEMSPEERLTRTGFFVGTLQYVAPETLSGELVDARADIYSLATIAFTLLTGRHPYTGRSPRELFQQILTEPPTPLNRAVPGLTFPDALEAAIQKGLSRDPAQRQANVAALAAEISSAAQGGVEPRRGLLGIFRRMSNGR